MKAYGYSKFSFEYTGEETCTESPREPGKWLIPANSTLTAPPEKEEGKAIRWTGEAWEQIVDNRGKTIYLREDSRIQGQMSYTLGAEVPEEYTLTAPPDAETWYKFNGTEWAEYTPPVTVADYDAAMEAHLLAERTARGYTIREPSDYKDSEVPRWKQDAIDWIAHRDAVMIYGLGVQNTYAATGEAPTLEAFKAGLPAIVWTYTEPEAETETETAE